MTLQQIFQKEVEVTEAWLRREQEESTYKRDLKKRIELINWVLQNMKIPHSSICQLIENRIQETMNEINKKDSVIEKDPLDSELRILDWVFYQVCNNSKKEFS